MRYYSSECPVLAATNGISYEIAVAGCNFHCKGCQNPELQDFNAGQELDELLMNSLINDIRKYESRIDNIDIIGGEPLDQPFDDLISFLSMLKSNFPNKGIWIYTGYEISQISSDILELCDYIKCGQYKEELRSDDGFKSEFGPWLVTSNQYIIKCEDELKRRNHNVKTIR